MPKRRTPRVTTLALVALLVAARGAGAEAPTPGGARPDAAFDRLCLALLLRAPERALGAFSPGSLRYYDGLLARARGGEVPRAAAAPSYEERAAVSALRSYAPAAVLHAPNAAEALRRALADEKLETDAASRLGLDRVVVDGERASGMISYEGAPTPFVVHYARDAGAWKIERIRLSPTLVSLLVALGVPPEVDPSSVERVAALWRSLAPRAPATRP